MATPPATNLSIGPCSTPKLGFDECMRAYADLGFRKFEAFTSWAVSALDLAGDPVVARDAAASYGMTYSSMHLPPIVADDYDASLQRAIDATHHAVAIGAPVVLFKASDRPTYIRGTRDYLAAAADLPVTPVLQNHAGAPISSLDDFRAVIDGIADDRMKTLLEVGHFHAVGVSWRQGYDLLGDSVALVHIKDMCGRQSVPYGTGEVDLPGLFAHLAANGYRGDFVVEMEVVDRENTLAYLGDALAYLRRLDGVIA